MGDLFLRRVIETVFDENDVLVRHADPALRANAARCAHDALLGSCGRRRHTLRATDDDLVDVDVRSIRSRSLGRDDDVIGIPENRRAVRRAEDVSELVRREEEARRSPGVKSDVLAVTDAVLVSPTTDAREHGGRRGLDPRQERG